MAVIKTTCSSGHLTHSCTTDPTIDAVFATWSESTDSTSGYIPAKSELMLECTSNRPVAEHLLQEFGTPL